METPKDKSPADLKQPTTIKHTSKWKKCKRCFVLITFIIVAVVVGVLYANPDLLSKEHYRQYIETKASELTGLRILLGDISISLDGPALVLKRLTVFAEEKPALIIEKAKAVVNLEKLMSGSIELDRLQLTNPRIILTRKEDGSFNIPLNSDDNSGASPENKILPLSVFRKVAIVDGSLSFSDKAIGDKPFTAKLSKFNLNIVQGSMPGTADISMSGQIDNRDLPASFEIDGTTSPRPQSDEVVFVGNVNADKIDVAKFWPYIRLVAPFQKASGMISINNKVETNFHDGYSSIGKIIYSKIDIRYKQAFRSPLKQKDMVITHDVVGVGDTLLVNDASVVAGDITIKSKGKITGISQENPFMSLTLDTNQVGFASLLKFVPDNALTSQQVSFIKRNIKKGKVRLNGIKFHGNLNQAMNLGDPDSYKAFSGLLSVSDVEMAFDEMTYDFNEINGVMKLEGGKLHVSGIKGRYGKSKLSQVTGVISRLYDWPLFDLSIKADLHLGDTIHGVSRRFASAEIKNILSNIDSITGTVNLDLAVLGDTKDLAKTLQFDGKTVFQNVGIESQEFGIPLYELDGILELSRQGFDFKDMTWKTGSSSFELAGHIKDVFAIKPVFDLQLKSQVNLEDIDKIKYLDFGSIYSHSGQALLDMNIRGSFDEFKISNRLDMTYTQFRFGKLLDKPLGFNNVYTLEGVVHKGSRAEINNLTIEAGESVVELSGSVGQFLRGQGFSLKVRSDGAQFDDLDSLMPGFEDIDSEGVIAGEFHIATDFDGGPVDLTGQVKLENAGFKIKLFHEPFRNGYATVDMFDHHLYFVGGRARLGDSPFKIEGTVKLKEKNEFALTANADTLNLYDLFGKLDGKKKDDTDKADKEDNKRNFFDGTWDINISADKGRIGPIHYQNLLTKIIYDEKQLRFVPLKFHAHGGEWKWESTMSIAPPPVSFESDIEIMGMNMEDYLAVAEDTRDVITGPLSVSGKISGRGETWEEMKKTFDGELHAKTGKGVIHRFKVLSKIFSLLNLTQYFKLRLPDLGAKGMPFDSISGDFTVKSGVASVENLHVASEAMRLSAVGDYDIASNMVDMKAGAMPLIAVDRVLSAIPLIGHVLTGDNKSFITSYYVIKGSLNDPEVKSVPVESVAVNVLGIFKRIITLPVRAIEKIKNGGKKSSKQKSDSLE